MNNLPTAIDLFCGAGGLSLGLRLGGFSVVGAVDNDDVAVRTYRDNAGDHAISASLVELPVEELLERTGLVAGECVLLAGGPPCQGFSVKRRGARNDPRNGLLREFSRFIDGVWPRFFLVENVKGLLSRHGASYLSEFIARAASRGYHCHVGQLDAVDFGVPQFRCRVFIVGERLDEGVRFSFPNPAVMTNDWRNVRHAIGDLPSPPEDGSPHPEFRNHYREARMSRTNLERIRHVPQGGGRQDLPEHLQLPCHKGRPTLRHIDVYGRLSWDRPSVTITARFDSFTRGRFGHPTEDRSLTLREGARIQTFPDSFVFHGNREDGARLIGNAVPPLLGRALAESILKAAGVKCGPVTSKHQVG